MEPKNINQSAFFHFVHFRSFNREKSDWVFVFLRSGDINRTMADIEIPRGDDFFPSLDQSLDFLLILLIEFKLVTEHFGSIGSFSTIWEIDIEKHKIWSLNRSYPPIIVHKRTFRELVQVFGYFKAFSVKNRSSRITGSFRAMPHIIIVLHCKSQLSWHLVFKGFYFLEAENIWIFLFDKIKEAFLKYGSDSVYISWDNFHREESGLKALFLKR